MGATTDPDPMSTLTADVPMCHSTTVDAAESPYLYSARVTSRAESSA